MTCCEPYRRCDVHSQRRLASPHSTYDARRMRVVIALTLLAIACGPGSERKTGRELYLAHRPASSWDDVIQFAENFDGALIENYA